MSTPIVMYPLSVPEDSPKIKIDVVCDNEEGLLRIPDDEEDQTLHLSLAVHATAAEVQALCEAMEDMTLTCGEKSTAGSCPLVAPLFQKLTEHTADQRLRPGAVLVRQSGDGLMEMELYLRGGNHVSESHRRFFHPCWWPKPQGANGARVLGLVDNHYDHWLSPNMCPGDEYECETGECRDCERGDTAEVRFCNVERL